DMRSILATSRAAHAEANAKQPTTEDCRRGSGLVVVAGLALTLQFGDVLVRAFASAAEGRGRVEDRFETVVRRSGERRRCGHVALGGAAAEQPCAQRRGPYRCQRSTHCTLHAR